MKAVAGGEGSFNMEKMDLSLDDIIRMKKPASAGSGTKAKANNSDGALNGVKKSNFKRQRTPVVTATSPRPAPPAASPSGKILVSNLASSVSAEDIDELFRGVGPLASFPVLHFDNSGKSLGSAEVTFQQRKDAPIAVKKYNGVSLDNKPMRIQLTMNEAGGIANRLGVRNSGETANGSRADDGGGQQQTGFQSHPSFQFNGNSYGHGRKNGKGQTKQGFNNKGQNKSESEKSLPAAEDLDQELEKYMDQHPSNSSARL